MLEHGNARVVVVCRCVPGWEWMVCASRVRRVGAPTDVDALAEARAGPDRRRSPLISLRASATIVSIAY